MLLGGCGTPNTALQAHAAGNFELARAEILSPSLDGAKRDGNDRLIWLMEEGKICLDAGDPTAARRALADGSDWCERFAIYEPKNTIQEEAASIAINQKMRVYRGTYSDRIMVDAYAVLASLWIGDTGLAAVYGNRVVERQTDAEVEQQKQIDKVSKEIRGYKGGSVDGMVEQVRRSPQMQGIVSDSGYAAYLNPFASWISAMAWSATGEGANRERASVALRQALSMVPSNQVVAAQLARNPFDVAHSTPQVLVLLEAGQGMSLKQLLIPIITPWVGFSSIPLPLPEVHPCDVASLSIRAGSAAIRTESLSDNDAIYKAQYDRMLPEIIFRTAVMVAAKEGATIAATQATRNNSTAQIGVLIGASVYKALTNQADLRSWRSVGKFTQIGQLDRPLDGRLEVSVVTSSGVTGPPARVELPPGQVVLLYVRSVSSAATSIYPMVLAGGGAPDASILQLDAESVSSTSVTRPSSKGSNP